MRRRSGTDGSLLTSLPWTLAALAFSVLPHVQFLPAWVTAIFFSCSGWRLLVERNRWRLPPAWVRIVLAMTCFIGVLASYESVSGVGPGSALLAVMAALKLLETKQRRDQFVLLFISIFLIMASLLREQYLWSLPYLVAGVMLTMTAWLRMSDATRIPVGTSVRAAARLMIYAAPLMLAMWVFFPRIATPFWSVPIDTSTASSGLSDQMSPGDISSLSLSNAVAFRVKFKDSMPPPHKRYWRGLVLNRFNGRTWTGNEPTFSRDRRNDIEYEGDPVDYQVTLEPTRQQWIFALDIPFDADLDRTFMASGHQLARMQPVDQRIVYNATSYPDFRMSNDLNDFWQDRFTHLPEDSNLGTVRLAQDMREAAGSNEAFINNVLRMFNREDFYYTLEPPALGSNPVDEFLFDTRRGFCEHYASAFAVLMRAAGIPTRIVLGYQGGEVNPVGNYLTVRQADAHAWTEVWLRGRGWYRVDPTAAVAAERIEMGRYGAMLDGIGESWGLTAPSQWAYRMEMAWDAVNAKWNEWILAYGPENQSRFMQRLGMNDPDWRQMMLTLIAVSVTLIAMVSLHLMIHYRPPRKDEAARLYRNFTSATGVELGAGESPLAFSARLAAERSDLSEAAATITGLYLESRYGPNDPDATPELRTAVSGFRGRS